MLTLSMCNFSSSSYHPWSSSSFSSSFSDNNPSFLVMYHHLHPLKYHPLSRNLNQLFSIFLIFIFMIMSSSGWERKTVSEWVRKNQFKSLNLLTTSFPTTKQINKQSINNQWHQHQHQHHHNRQQLIINNQKATIKIN